MDFKHKGLSFTSHNAMILGMGFPKKRVLRFRGFRVQWLAIVAQRF